MYAALHYPWLQGFNAHTVAHAVFELAARRASFGEGVRAALAPSAEYFQTLHLPDALIHWGHPGSMAVVLVAMGLYGSGYLGWQLRLSDDTAVVTKARALHPRLALGMTGFFALGAVGGMMSLIMQDRPVFASPHVTTGLWGLGLLSLQAMLPLLFADEPGLRTVHAYLGSAILTLFCVHAVLGLQLGLSLA